MGQVTLHSSYKVRQGHWAGAYPEDEIEQVARAVKGVVLREVQRTMTGLVNSLLW